MSLLYPEIIRKSRIIYIIPGKLGGRKLIIVERIRKLIEQNGITVNSFQKKMGFSNSLIKSWETNDPSAYKVIQIADYFGVSVDYLLGRTDEMLPPNTSLQLPDEVSELIRYIQESSLNSKEALYFTGIIKGYQELNKARTIL